MYACVRNSHAYVFLRHLVSFPVDDFPLFPHFVGRREGDLLIRKESFDKPLSQLDSLVKLGKIEVVPAMSCFAGEGEEIR